MNPERIQFALSLPTAPTFDRGVYQTFEFESLSKAENFAEFVADMADNHGIGVSCQIHSRTYVVRVLVRTLYDASEASPAIGAWEFLDKVEDIHLDWSPPVQES